MSDITFDAASDRALKIVEGTLAAIRNTYQAVANAQPGDNDPRLFFPGGIELIYFSFKIGSEINITIAVAGEKAKYPSSSAPGQNDIVIGDGDNVYALEPD